MALAGERPILIKKIKKGGGHAHHGGAWKVAYADFVTAMMAFFLLMWLINTTSPEQKRGIADYFAPASVSEASSGAGGILGGTALGDDGNKNQGSMQIMEQMAPEAPPSPQDDGQSSTTGAEAALREISEDAMRQELQPQEAAAFASAAASLRQAMQSLPELAELSKHVLVDQTPEGLRIQLVDQEGRSMFEPGSARPNGRARLLLREISRVVNQLPNRVTISGHTSAQTAGRSEGDWSLSSGRANATREILQGSGVDPDRVYQVSGKAASDPLYPDDPTLAGNRRITLVLLREAPVLPPDAGL